MSEAIIDLQIRLEHQENVLNELSDIVAKQQRAIERLVAEVRHLSTTQAEGGGVNRSTVDEAPPPHY